MKKNSKIRLFALFVMIFAIALPFVMTLFPQTIPLFSYPLVSITIVVMPALFSLLVAPVLANRLVLIYKFYHKSLKHDFITYYDRQEPKISRLHVSLLTSLFPLAIVFRISANPIAVNEIDMVLISLVFMIQFFTIIFSYSIFIISKTKLMVVFDNGISKFNLGERLRDKMNYATFGSLFFIIIPSYEALTHGFMLFFITLIVSVGVCFGSNIIGFLILDHPKIISRTLLDFKRLQKTPDYGTD